MRLIPVVFVASIDRLPQESWQASLGRVAMSLGLSASLAHVRASRA
jgi:hypothetical protein